MKTNRQQQSTRIPQKWIIGGLTVLLTGAGGVWYINQSPESSATRFEQVASSRRFKPVETPATTTRVDRPKKPTDINPGTVRVTREEYQPKNTDRNTHKRNPERKEKKEKVQPAA